MAALHASAHMHARADFVAASMAVAIAAPGLALWLAAGRRAAAADPVGHCLRLCDLRHALHGDGGPDGSRTRRRPSAPALSTDLLAIVVAVVAFSVSGIFLLLLVPDRARQPTAAAAAAGHRAAGARHASATRNRGLPAPAPGRRVRIAEPTSSDTGPTPRSAAPALRRGRIARRLPVERATA